VSCEKWTLFIFFFFVWKKFFLFGKLLDVCAYLNCYFKIPFYLLLQLPSSK
jgi:hypothetical protein